MVASRPGLAHFRRIYFAASAAWIADAVGAGHVLGSGDACAFLDPPGDGNLWLHAVAGPPGSLLGLLGRLVRLGAAGGGTLTVEAPAGAEIQSGLDALGFEPAGAPDRYLVLEAPTGAQSAGRLESRDRRLFMTASLDGNAAARRTSSAGARMVCGTGNGSPGNGPRTRWAICGPRRPRSTTGGAGGVDSARFGPLAGKRVLKLDPGTRRSIPASCTGWRRRERRSSPSTSAQHRGVTGAAPGRWTRRL